MIRSFGLSHILPLGKTNFLACKGEEAVNMKGEGFLGLRKLI